MHFVTGLLLGHLPSSCSSKKRFHRGLRAHSQNEHNRGRFVAFCRGQYSAYDAVIALLPMRLFPGPGYRHQLRPNVDLPENDWTRAFRLHSHLLHPAGLYVARTSRPCGPRPYYGIKLLWSRFQCSKSGHALVVQGGAGVAKLVSSGMVKLDSCVSMQSVVVQ